MDASMPALAAERSMNDHHQEGRSIHPFFGKRTMSRESLPTNEHPPVLASLSTNSNLSQIVDNCTNISAELFSVDPNQDRRKRFKSSSPHEETFDQKVFDQELPKETRTIKSKRTEKSGAADVDDHGQENIPQPPTEIGKTDRLVNLIASEHPRFLENSLVYTDMQKLEKRTDRQLMGNMITNPLLQAPTVPPESDAVNPECTVGTAKLTTPIPQKILRLNPKTGTIGSPPLQKTSGKRSGGGQRTILEQSPKQPKSLLICISYGQNCNTRANVRKIISQILSGTITYALLKKPPHSSPAPTVDVKLPKTTHPFFLGKTALKAVVRDAMEISPDQNVLLKPKPEAGKTSMTLGEAKSLAPIKNQLLGASSGFFSSFGSSNKMPKLPGAIEACWPQKGMVHVRGYNDKRKASFFSDLDQLSLSAPRKSKYVATETLAKDDVLKVYGKSLGIVDLLNDIQKIDDVGFIQPEKCLRIPGKYFESGLQMQCRVRQQLFTRLPWASHLEGSASSEDELQGDLRDKNIINAALLKTYNGIATSLTAFDRCQYETQSWIQKYAPSCAAEVLQPGKEASILREWLQGLTVLSVETGTRDNSQSRGDSVTRKPTTTNAEKASKKKRKSNKLEGFVISSDEEDNCMDEISDLEDQSSSQLGISFPKRTVIRNGSALGIRLRDQRRLKNAVVISGPTGCGKSAMVYAVAKELGFEVFEINPSSRRSGKEILEKVGDMTRNHLVHSSEQHDLIRSQDEVTQRISDALAADLESGRQGILNSFFKPRQTTHSNADSRGLKSTRKNLNANVSQAKAPPKAQKQSLILLEEVDVLYEEDKQFWTTIMNLITTSKRPIIMTCNDETVLPLQALTLHAIIRLSPPPMDITVDYMLLVAASEGHILKRKAVKALYEARNYDLRASLTELNFWCQLGIGDRKGGLDWCYPRWPPGCDLDRNGNTIRVVSEGTYKTGMGWLGRDLICDILNEPEKQGQLYYEAWDGWNIDAGDLYHNFDSSHAVNESSLRTLSSYEDFTNSMSAADIFARGSLSTGNQVSLDISSPPISAKVREDFIVGYELLQADTVACYQSVQKNIPLWIKSQARLLLHSGNPSEDLKILETRVFSHIANTGRKQDELIDRKCFSLAFDPLAFPDKISQQTGSALDCSVFDRTTSLIAIDVAPFVRSIVAYDVRLQQKRAKLSNLLSEGGRKGKRIRTTRSAISALEGGARNTTRPEKYFQAELNPYSVQRTGLKYWQDAVASETELESRFEKVDPATDWDENSISGVSSGQ